MYSTNLVVVVVVMVMVMVMVFLFVTHTKLTSKASEYLFVDFRRILTKNSR